MRHPIDIPFSVLIGVVFAFLACQLFTDGGVSTLATVICAVAAGLCVLLTLLYWFADRGKVTDQDLSRFGSKRT